VLVEPSAPALADGALARRRAGHRADPPTNYGGQMSQLSAQGDQSQPSMKPRALILDLFGDYLRYTGGQARAGDLVTLLGVFDVEPAAVRMTLSRLRREHWFTTTRHGREASYVLNDHMLGVLQVGRDRIFADYDEAWDHTWTTVVQQSAKTDRLAREQLRRQLSWLGFGSLSASTWVNPRDRSDQVRALAGEFPDVHFTVLRSVTDDLDVDRDLVTRCWDLKRMNQLYAQFLKDHARLGKTADELTGADALVARTELIGSYRHYPFFDPWLPAELRPKRWLGAQANALFRAAHRDLGPAASAFVGSVVGSLVEAPFI
jgi:phenylacetic acid degradation operon negative regulatory protein